MNFLEHPCLRAVGYTSQRPGEVPHSAGFEALVSSLVLNFGFFWQKIFTIFGNSSARVIKFEYRISKSETNSKLEFSNVKNSAVFSGIRFLMFRSFELQRFGHCFVFRYSCFVFPVYPGQDLVSKSRPQAGSKSSYKGVKRSYAKASTLPGCVFSFLNQIDDFQSGSQSYPFGREPPNFTSVPHLAYYLN